MSEEARGRGRRRLAAILFAGLSQLFPGDEKESFAGLIAFAADVVGPKVAEYGGRIVSVRSEAVLVEFKSVVDAVRCAASLREAAAQRNQELLDEQRIAMRIGINLGDIIAEGDDVFGDGVNIAARIVLVQSPRQACATLLSWQYRSPNAPMH